MACTAVCVCVYTYVCEMERAREAWISILVNNVSGHYMKNADVYLKALTQLSYFFFSIHMRTLPVKSPLVAITFNANPLQSCINS